MLDVLTSSGKVGRGLMEHDVRVAGGTAGIAIGQLLIVKLRLCPVTFCNYKCINIGLFHNSAVF
jgi:hypothetical protein